MVPVVQSESTSIGREVEGVGELIIQELDLAKLPAMLTTGKHEPWRWWKRAYDVTTPYFPPGLE
jgi:hypothetical protein